MIFRWNFARLLNIEELGHQDGPFATWMSTCINLHSRHVLTSRVVKCVYTFTNENDNVNSTHVHWLFTGWSGFLCAWLAESFREDRCICNAWICPGFSVRNLSQRDGGGLNENVTILPQIIWSYFKNYWTKLGLFVLIWKMLNSITTIKMNISFILFFVKL